MAGRSRPSMSPLEDTVMRVLWAKESCTADEVRQALLRRQPMKDSTVRTILRRLEAKGYVSHEIAGRTYVYRPRLPARQAATQAVRRIVDRLCAGSIEQLLQGMVSDRIVTAEQLEELARKIAEAEAGRKQEGEGNTT
jgi:BlaI family transcriptional regulator, penicillinase repressor